MEELPRPALQFQLGLTQFQNLGRLFKRSDSATVNKWLKQALQYRTCTSIPQFSMASNSSNPTAADIARATLRTPVRDSSARRYSANMQRLRDMFAKAGTPLNDPENKFCALDKRSPDCSPVSIAIELITARCGRVLNPENVDLGRNKGKSTGGDIRSSLRQLFRELDCRRLQSALWGRTRVNTCTGRIQRPWGGHVFRKSC